ncbi:esterase-like activity of phytase family protein [uncultured Roseobacter sp.]|uniref:esterase-like activity of phytase family protein n=1 Tax=uncultured Roseobacter sp. TaxID=114847 RepID=UPI00263A3A18|nr:esterase-like activity of phytase family protein [uncultured Roseobacter sp.]
MTRLPVYILAATLLPLTVSAQEMVPATLAGHAVLPAMSFSAPPGDAPRETWVSGRFTDGAAPVNTPQSVARNGVMRPFFGQPLQGFSGYALNRAEDDSLYALIDNGFGSKANSSDALLGFTRITPDFETGQIDVRARVWLHDPDRLVPFRITHEATETRYLTGADFDLEGLQIVGETAWIGEEFGPYLISASLDGRVTGVFPTLVEGEELRSPDHPALQVPAVAGTDWRLPRSGGYEGLALTPDQALLWAMLEKPLLAEDGESEGNFLRVLAFDPDAREWTGDSFKFALTEGAVAIGDFNFIDETRALVIERDGGQGHPSAACAEGQTEECFDRPAEVKRVTLIDTAQIDEDGFVARIAQIDLMEIRDPDGISRMTDTSGDLAEGIFAFPFVTIESVLRDGPEHILVSNDNNLPFSAGRTLGVADSNEVIRLHVPDLLNAR